MIKTAQQAKSLIQSLTDSVWISSALLVLAEANLLPILSNGATSSELEKLASFSPTLLLPIISLLKEVGILIEEDKKFKFAAGFSTRLSQSSAEQITAQLQTHLGQAHALILSARNKTLQPGWSHTDETILLAQGIRSEYIVTETILSSPPLQALLNTPQAMCLDVGAGVGKISLQLCQHYPNLRVVALEPADKPYTLAKSNIQQSKFSHRIELRKIFVEEMNDQQLFSAAWFPHVFFSNETLVKGLKSVYAALKPGGMLFTTI